MSQKFVRMLCPVCGKYRFTEPEHFDENTIIKCPNCGWIYDLAQTEDVLLKNGKNKLCYEDYFEKYIMNRCSDENYDCQINNEYKKHKHKKAPHKCPICGKYEFPDRNSYDICPNCGWEDEEASDEDDLISYILGANGMTKQRYREQYEKLLKEDPNYTWENAVKNRINN